MSLNLRIFLAYFLVVGVATYLLLDVFMSELRPGVRQSTEDSLVDMSNLLAELVADEFIDNQLDQQDFAKSMDRFIQRSYRAKIWTVNKELSKIRIYITDAKGIVRYDSADIAVGQNYSQWNDVYLTLQGQYGARSTRSDPDDESSSVMYVAAAIKNVEEIVGVLTVAKPNLSVQPFINIAKNKIRNRGLLLVGLSLLVAIMLSYWLTASIRKLASYSDKVASGERVRVPKVRETELAKLADSIENMRRQLEGKDYVEKYVHALTHELKSPVSAIKGAAEIIDSQMPAQDLSRFMDNIRYEVERIDEMINRLLALVDVEKREVLEHVAVVDMVEVINDVLESKEIAVQDKRLKLVLNLPNVAVTNGDRFLLMQAVDNLLQNAIDFSPEEGQIRIEVNQEKPLSITILDQGPGIPDYAEAKIFDRFYSLARPISQKKSSGLGLCFVKQIAELHGGYITVKNQPGSGVLAVLYLPS